MPRMINHGKKTMAIPTLPAGGRGLPGNTFTQSPSLAATIYVLA